MTYEFEGKTEKDAIEKAAIELGLETDQFDVDVRGGQLHREKRGDKQKAPRPAVKEGFVCSLVSVRLSSFSETARTQL